MSNFDAQSAEQPPSPQIRREPIEWTDAWIVDGQGTSLPRVLLIGDSITRAYYPSVAQSLKGLASVSRVATSRSVGDPGLADELIPTLKAYLWDVIHFNNGLHGWDYTEEEYEQAFPAFIATIKEHAPGAKLILATTTPVVEAATKSTTNPRTDRVIARNQIATEDASSQNIPVDDLFTLSIGHPEHYDEGGIHFNSAGIALQAAQVATSIAPLLPVH